MTFKDLAQKFHDLIIEVQKQGGNLVFVGGCVRDLLLHQTPKDFDAEVYGLTPEVLEILLKKFGPLKIIGKRFGIFYPMHLGIEVAIPRVEKKIGQGHKGFDVALDPTLSFKDASSRRDLTINSMGYDPLRNEILDPWGGEADLRAGILRPTNPESFGEDPLRALRVAQFAARFVMTPTDALITLCSQLDLSELPSERVLEEMKKLLIKGVKPSYGLIFLRDAGLLGFFQDLALTEDLLQWVDQAAGKRLEGSMYVDFSLMITLLTLPMKDPKPFLQGLKVSHQVFKQVFFLYQTFYKLNTSSEYVYRKMAFDFDKSSIAIEKFFVMMDILKGPNALRASFDRLGALDLQKIRPIIKGRHLLKWCPELSPEAFQDVLEACHAIQLQEGLFEMDALWERYNKRK